MTKLNLKLIILSKLFLIFFSFFLYCVAEEHNKNENFIVMGSNEASIKIKIFSSFTCPHCADFHLNVIPKIKEKYVDTKMVQIIFIDFPLDLAAFNASKLLHCLDSDMQINFIDEIYKKQDEWTNGSDIENINSNLKKIVKDLGINYLNPNSCLNNEDISDKILNYRIDAQKKYSINSTPTIIINEKKFEGSAIFKNIEKKIKKHI